MIDLADIYRAIDELQRRDADFDVCAKLADLYTVRAHLSQQSSENSDAGGGGMSYSRAGGLSREDRELADVIADLIETLSVVTPSLYHSFMRRIGRED